MTPSTTTPKTAQPLLDIEGVATSLGVTPRLLRRLVAERRIPFLKVGKFVRFDPAELSVWIDQQRIVAAPHLVGVQRPRR